MRLRERYLRRFPAASATPPPSLSQSRRGRSTDAQRRYQELRSLLRRNQQMWAVESEWVSRHQTDPSGETITDLLLYEFFGHRSQRSRRREAQLRRWVARLNQIQYQLEAASAALDAGLWRFPWRLAGSDTGVGGWCAVRLCGIAAVVVRLAASGCCGSTDSRRSRYVVD